jgi:regulator of nucleoside diphosphate kinase
MNGIWLTRDDVDAIALMLGERSNGSHEDRKAVAALADVLASACSDAGSEPAQAVTLGSAITYRDAAGACHTVTVVYPIDADPLKGRVSVLSPVGRALLGRQLGSDGEITSACGERVAIRIVALNESAGAPA